MNTLYIKNVQDSHVQAHHAAMIVQESKRIARTCGGTEHTEAKARSKRLVMAQMGLSSTNLVFDSELAESHLDPEVLKILKDDPEKDTGIMHTRVPVDAQTSTIGESDRGGLKSLDTDQDDDEQYNFIEGFDLSDLETIASGSQRIIDRLPLFIHDLKRWSNGFNVIKFKKAEKLHHKQLLAACVDSESLTVNGTIRKRAPETKPRRKRVARRSRSTHSNTLMS